MINHLPKIIGHQIPESRIGLPIQESDSRFGHLIPNLGTQIVGYRRYLFFNYKKQIIDGGFHLYTYKLCCYYSSLTYLSLKRPISCRKFSLDWDRTLDLKTTNPTP